MHRVPFLRIAATIVCAIAAAPFMSGQNSIQLFGPVNVRSSASGTGFGESAVNFNSANLVLNCNASPIQAVLSSTPDGTGNVLVDNFINLTVTAGETTTGPTNVCRGGISEGTPDGTQQDCFTSGYQVPASAGQLTGQDPDNFTGTGGVAPIDVSSSLQAGTVQTQFSLVDTGGFLASSSIYLNTNCTQAGVSGPANITGNPISSTNPTPQQLTQNFSYDQSTNQQVQFTYDLTDAETAGSLSITNGTIPNTTDQPIDPSTFQSVWVPNTSFATSSCIVHTGELLPNGSSACKLYTLECQVGTGSGQSGAQCPVSQLANEVFQDVFDGPAFTLPDIVVPNGPTFHQGVGLLMAAEPWTGGSCLFDPASGFATALCPQNVLTNFSGPGGYASTGRGTNPNSSFISVAQVPEDLTTVTVTGQQPGGWINTQNPTVSFSSQPPIVPGQNTFVPAPIKSITYGISPAGSVPTPGPPVPNDTTLTNPIPCPTSQNPLQPPATTYAPPSQVVNVMADGQYQLHYYAKDCAGTEELKFTQDGTGSWSTNFYTFPINVDTVAPAVASGPILSPAPSTNYGTPNSYTQNQKVIATYSCTDDRSGVVLCGTSTFSPGSTLNTGPLTSNVDTSTTGSHTFTVAVKDAAGNTSSASVTYTVVAALPVNLTVAKLAPLAARKNDLITYSIGAINVGNNTANTVVISDPLPSGVSFVSATGQIFVCTLFNCSLSKGAVSCSYASNKVTCTTSSLTGSTLWGFAEFGVQIVTRVTASAGAKIANTATVSSANPDSSPRDNQSTALTLVVK